MYSEFKNMCTHLTEDTILRLVEIYKEYECLWNVKHAFYKDRETRERAYSEIIKKLNVPGLNIKDIPKKIKGVRKSYYKESKRIKLGIERGKVYKPKVLWYSIADEFLSQFRTKRELLLKRLAETNEENEDLEEETYGEPSRVEKIAEKKKKEDEFDSFGKYIATILRSMPQEFSIIAKTELQRTVLDIQLRIVRESIRNGSTNSPHYASGYLTPTSDSYISHVKIESDT